MSRLAIEPISEATEIVEAKTNAIELRARYAFGLDEIIFHLKSKSKNKVTNA